MAQDKSKVHHKDKSEGYLAGKLLLAMPGMGDPRFHKSVIYICAHDAEGAMGLVINHPLEHVAFEELLEQLKITADNNLDLAAIDITVMRGGPVEGARGFLLHSNDFSKTDTVKVDGDIYITGTLDALKDVASGKGPKQRLFILGYAGWTAGQLDQELQENAWLTVEGDPELIFQTLPEEKWERAVKKLGIDPSMLSAAGGSA
ncbi:MAG: YqgE/AlgH family protein [Micavibrio sp.]|nr:YqgE/AlgH family protein [Micavibrio sp.]|tara:strand:+ start:1693 stop:2301 length:609 start_codon:yes stop_codon:yes gene_type:complete